MDSLKRPILTILAKEWLMEPQITLETHAQLLKAKIHEIRASESVWRQPETEEKVNMWTPMTVKVRLTELEELELRSKSK